MDRYIKALNELLQGDYNYYLKDSNVKVILEAFDKAKKYDELINSETTCIGGKGVWRSFEFDKKHDDYISLKASRESIKNGVQDKVSRLVDELIKRELGDK